VQTTLRYLLAILVSLAAFGFVFMMVANLGKVDIDMETAGNLKEQARMLAGLKKFFIGMGGAFLMAGAAYIMVGRENPVVTALSPAEQAKSPK
jgi:hypothetical protein